MVSTWEFSKETCVVSVNYGKAFDRMKRNLLWPILMKKCYLVCLIEKIGIIFKP